MTETKQINWFPGHMAKATRNIQEAIKNVDLIIEVVDARAINATSNPDFNKVNKPHLKVALKADAADLTSIQAQPNLVVGSTKDKGFKNTLINEIKKVLNPLAAKKKAKGIVKPTFYIMVVGLPNVGKSSLINLLAGKKVAVVGNRPAVTKNQATIKIAEDLYLQDNPGVFFKNVKSLEEGYTLALLNTIRKEVLPLDEVVKFCYNFLSNKYPHLLFKVYEVKDMSYEQFKVFIANKRNFVKAGNEPDLLRVIDSLYDDFVNGSIGKINYEK